MLIDIIERVRAAVPDHLRGRCAPDIETQINFDDQRFRIPHDGNGEPNFSDHANHPPFDKLVALGTTGWNWVDQRSLFFVYDFDSLVGHVQGLDVATLDELVRAFLAVEEVEIIRSKSGKGIHVIAYCDPDHLPRAAARDMHIDHARRALQLLAGRLKLTFDLEAAVDAVGVVGWIWHRDKGEHGFKLLKRSTAFLPAGWENAFPNVPTVQCDLPDYPTIPLSPKHQTIIDRLAKSNKGEWKNGRLTTHTAALQELVDDPSLKIPGSFSTLATGKNLPSDRNCWGHPDVDGSWRIFRFGKGTKEHESWWASSGGWTTTWFARGKTTRADPTTVLVNIAKDDDLFHDADGRAFVTTKIRDIRETLPLSDARYRAKLRLGFTNRIGQIATAETIKTALQQLEAIALLERPEYTIAIRAAEHDTRLYIDLCNLKRQIVEVTATGWRVVNDCPVRFLRPFGMLPLPVPLPGGNLDDLKRFINVEAEDLPLFLAFLVGFFHPTGPYALLQIVGEQGSAKSFLMRLIADFLDPHIATGNTMPRDERDLLVAAQLRRLLSYDNVDSLNRKMSSLLCMVVTGAGSANRKLFTDADQSILRAKRPIVLTAIANVVEASDLLDRTLTLVLPPIPAERRKSEFAIAQELRREGVRGRILGYILNGVVAALAGHASVTRDDMPRLADFFSWATAAESGLGQETGSAITAYKRQAAEESAHVVTSQLGAKIVELCNKAWNGTAGKLAEEIGIGLSARQIANHLREIAPDLRREGYSVRFKKTDGMRIIELGVRSPAVLVEVVTP